MSSDWVPKAFEEFHNDDQVVGQLVGATNEVFKGLAEVKAVPGQCVDCVKCNRPGATMNFDNKPWHPKCLECESCFRPIVSEADQKKGNVEVYKVRDRLTCKRCFAVDVDMAKGDGDGEVVGRRVIQKPSAGAVNRPSCAGCKNQFAGGAAVLKMGEDRYHQDCFKCTACKQVLRDGYRMWDGSPHCTRCASNKTPFIEGQGNHGDYGMGLRVDPRTGRIKQTGGAKLAVHVNEQAKPAPAAAAAGSVPKAFCSGCGAKNASGGRFCGECGIKLAD